MAKEDIYTVENDFSNCFELYSKCLHKQVVYRDNRTYQSLIIEWKNYRLQDSREFIKTLEKDSGIMDMLSKVQPFASYGFTSNKLAITFKKDLKLSKTRALALLRYITELNLKTSHLYKVE